MKNAFKVFVMCMALSSVVFVSCKKDGDKEEGKGDSAKVCHFNAQVQMSADFIAACENITFKYKDADGKEVTTVVDASKLKSSKYTNPVNDQEFDVFEWTCKFDYKDYPAEVYFKPVVQFKEAVSFENKADFIFYPIIFSGVYPTKVVANYDKAEIKLGVKPEGVSLILNNLSNTISAIEVDTTIE